MELQTQVPLQQARNRIDYQSQMLLIGSCFVEHIGDKLEYYKYRSLKNPFGILFSPKAIELLVTKAIEGTNFSEEVIFNHNGRWHCYGVHSSLSQNTKGELLQTLDRVLEQTRQQLAASTHILVTLGTAWVYRHKASNSIVANCHKVPQKEFKKELLSVDTIIASLGQIIAAVRRVNPKAQLIFTVSPVRHLKDGFVENQRSKAHLLTAIHQTIAKKSNGPGDDAYFPSYEIMMDELRDYRFYVSDMVHPNQLAVDYIWQKFKKVWISETAHATMERVAHVQKGLQHRPFNPASEQHQKFVKALEEKVGKLQSEYPFMKF